MFSTLRTKALLALTGLAAIGGLVALPGSASAARVSIEMIFAWAYGLRRNDPCSMPGRLMSST